jgi:uncharacterized protein YjdB
VVPVPVAALLVSLSSSTVRIGQVITAQAAVRDSAGNLLSRTVGWSSSNAQVVTISASGVVTGVGEGTASVVATVDGRSASAVVTVTAPPVASLSIMPTTATVAVGGTSMLQATAYDSAGNPMAGLLLRWSTGNATVVTVNGQGVLFGVGIGTTYVSAESGGRTVSARVNVVTVGAVSEVYAAPRWTTLLPGQTQQLTQKAFDAYGLEVLNRPATYASSDITIATVNSTGLVRATGPGTTTVTITVDGKSSTMYVQVVSTFGQPFAMVAATTHGLHEQMCAVTREGRAYCTGVNSSGQLGDGTFLEKDTLVAVATAVRFRTIATARDHACGVAVDGTAWCWGDNESGQLGDGSVLTRQTPSAVSASQRFTSIVTGAGFTCGLATDASAWCWGSNAYRGLGAGTAMISSRVPVPVAGGHRFASMTVIRAGKAICGISILQQLLCWGERIPDGTYAARATPVEIGEGRRYTHVADNYHRTCALDTGGSIWCTSREYEVFKWQRSVGSYEELFSGAGGEVSCARERNGALRCAFGRDPDTPTPIGLPVGMLTLSLGPATDLYGVDANGRLLHWAFNGSSLAWPGPRTIVVP